jgi:hypothetical protein
MSSNKSFLQKLRESWERGRERGRQENERRAKEERATTERSSSGRGNADWENKGLLDIYREMGKGIVKSSTRDQQRQSYSR